MFNSAQRSPTAFPKQNRRPLPSALNARYSGIFSRLKTLSYLKELEETHSTTRSTTLPRSIVSTFRLCAMSAAADTGTYTHSIEREVES